MKWSTRNLVTTSLPEKVNACTLSMNILSEQFLTSDKCNLISSYIENQKLGNLEGQPVQVWDCDANYAMLNHASFETTGQGVLQGKLSSDISFLQPQTFAPHKMLEKCQYYLYSTH